MLSKTANRNSRWEWQHAATIALTLLLTILFSGSLAPRVTDAAPPAQAPDYAAQAQAIAQAFRQLGLTPQISNNENLPGSDNYYSVKAERGLSNPTRTESHIAFISKKADDIPDLVAMRMVSPPPPLRSLSFGRDPASITGSSYTPDQTSGGQRIFYTINDATVRFGCNTVFVIMMFHYDAQLGVRDETSARAETARQQTQLEQNAENTARQFYQALQTLNACSSSGAIGVGHGCSYNEPNISPGQLRCAATTTNALPNATIEYAWKLDGNAQSEKGNSFTRADKDIAPGTHTLVVVAKDTKNNKEASSSFTFAKPGGTMSVSVQCAVRADNASAVTCYADVKDAPAGAALTYEWTWNNASEGEPSRTLNKTGLKDGSYTITVRAKESSSGKTASASTTVQVSAPAQPPAAKPPAAQPPEICPTAQTTLTSPTGTQTINPNVKTPITLVPGSKAELKAQCCQKVYALLYMATITDIEEFRMYFLGYAIMQQILCDRIKVAAPVQIARAGPLARPLFQQGAAPDTAAQIQIEVSEGGVQLEIANAQVGVDAVTPAVTVSAIGMNTFEVTYDPATNASAVSVSRGQVTVQPSNPAQASSTWTLDKG